MKVLSLGGSSPDSQIYSQDLMQGCHNLKSWGAGGSTFR